MRVWMGLLLGSLLLAAGCSKPVTQIGGKPRPVDAFVRTAVSLSPSTTELVPGKAYAIQLLGRTASCNYPDAAKQAEVVMNGVKPNFDRIAQIGPNLVIYDASLYSDADIQKLEQLKIRTFGLKAQTIAEFKTSIYELGAVLGEETNMAEYVAEIEQALASGRVADGQTKPKVAVMMPGQRGDHYVVGTQSFLADLIRQCGGEPVGPDSGKFEPISVERFIADNPDIIIASRINGPILSDPRLRSVNAVKNKFVAPFDEDRLLRKGARVPELIRGMADYIKNPVAVPLGN